jgi:hypothetical protein
MPTVSSRLSDEKTPTSTSQAKGENAIPTELIFKLESLILAQNERWRRA